MSGALLIVGLLAPDSQTAAEPTPAVVMCKEMISLTSGTVAPCTGILWSEDQTKDALACQDVTVPRLELKLNTFQHETAIRTEQYKAQLAYREQIIQDLIKNKSEPVLANYWQVASGILLGALTATMVVITVK